jgi:esterase/lipase superfamily enzyme
LLVASHSLGGRLVSDVLAGDARADTAPAHTAVAETAPDATLRALAFLALDQDAVTFADTLLPALQPRARRVVLYSSRRDRALTISRRMHDSPRAGLADSAPLVRDGLETVDVTEAFAADSWFQRLFGNRHSVRRASALLWDLTHIVGRGLAPACRDTVALGTRDADGAWRLRAAARPDTTRIAGCHPLGTASTAARSRSTP